MADWSDVLAATRAVVDPSTSAEDLAAIAQAQKGLWVQIASHPNAYPALLDWLSSQGDESVRAAVASRQQPTNPSLPVPPPPPANEPAATHPVPKRFKKPLLISGAGVLVAVAVVLVIVFTTGSSSMLQASQLQTLAANLGGEEVRMMSGEKIQQEYYDTDNDSCTALFGNQGPQGGVWFDLPNSSGDWSNVEVYVFENRQRAVSAMDQFEGCVFGDDDIVRLNTQEVSSVSMSLWQNPNSLNESYPMAVYANVLWFSDANTSVAWDEWQTYATTTFKSAVNQAIKS